MDRTEALADILAAGRVVIKVGSSLLVKPQGHAQGELPLDLPFIEKIADEIVFLRSQGKDVLLVSSGAVALGRSLLKQYPAAALPETSLSVKQALSSMGQPGLMQVYSEVFRKRNIPVAQLLLTARDFRSRRSYLNIGHTLEALLKAGVLPVVNENDAVSTAELQFGENDILSAACAALFRARLLLILTSVDGFLLNGVRVAYLSRITDEIRAAARGPAGPGSGGMQAKIRAAELCLLAGQTLAILPGSAPAPVREFFAGQDTGTLFAVKGGKQLSARKRWILYSMEHGSIAVDDGAARALIDKGSSLLPAGITGCRGSFWPGDVVVLYDAHSRLLGRGIVNYSSREVQQASGGRSSELGSLLSRGVEIIHRDNLVLAEYRNDQAHC